MMRQQFLPIIQALKNSASFSWPTDKSCQQMDNIRREQLTGKKYKANSSK
jgi:hypothetical protein